MKVKNLKIIGYRSIDNTEVISCGDLNVFIGKNNAGKSNILASIELIQSHLSKSTISSKWVSTRPLDEFYNRDYSKGIRFAVEFEFSEDSNSNLRTDLQLNYPNLERATSELEKFNSIVFVLSGNRIRNKSFIYTEQIVIGKLVAAEGISSEGITLLNVSRDVAYELFEIQESLTSLRTDVQYLKEISSRIREYGYLFNNSNKESVKASPQAYLNNITNANRLSLGSRKHVESLLASSGSQDDFVKGIDLVVDSLKSDIDKAVKKETSKPFTTFAGETRIQPDYVGVLMNTYGSQSLLHLRETKAPIGREEAAALLKLKITRGGPERLKIVQNTVRALLGVEVDAFQPEDAAGLRSPAAEMDVDQFLAEANGAGVREALRLILDLELKQPKLVLIEEPEVHLHPGLEYAMYSYLRDKSKTQQIFVTTHSTNFVDSVSFQNIYLVAREVCGTKISVIDESNGALKIPTSLGLRLSTVFMYDRLLFVEGPSDEAVLREFARILDIDLAGANANFVQMGGIGNFAHFAAEGTLSLLSRKNLKIWFLTDRDERTDEDVQTMLERLGDNAKLHVTESRDLENYLLNAKAVHRFVSNKLETVGSNLPSIEEVVEVLNGAAVSLQQEVITRRVDNKLLKPIYLQNRKITGSLDEKLRAGIAELQKRLDSVDTVKSEIEISTAENWSVNAKKLTPGAEILDKCCQHFGVRFLKDAGDSAKLASYMTKDSIPREITTLLREVTTRSE